MSHPLVRDDDPRLVPPADGDFEALKAHVDAVSDRTQSVAYAEYEEDGVLKRVESAPRPAYPDGVPTPRASVDNEGFLSVEHGQVLRSRAFVVDQSSEVRADGAPVLVERLRRGGRNAVQRLGTPPDPPSPDMIEDDPEAGAEVEMWDHSRYPSDPVDAVGRFYSPHEGMQLDPPVRVLSDGTPWTDEYALVEFGWDPSKAQYVDDVLEDNTSPVVFEVEE